MTQYARCLLIDIQLLQFIIWEDIWISKNNNLNKISSQYVSPQTIQVKISQYLHKSQRPIHYFVRTRRFRTSVVNKRGRRNFWLLFDLIQGNLWLIGIKYVCFSKMSSASSLRSIKSNSHYQNRIVRVNSDVYQDAPDWATEESID